MGSVYLDGNTEGVPSLLDALLPGEREGWYFLVTVDGWEQRARKSGGFDGRAKGVSHHHDAGTTANDGWPSVQYETFTSENAPITALHLDRTATVWICAGGATNTVGQGGPMGDFALDDGNAWQIGIEAGNDGLGEEWNETQVRAYVEVSARLWLAYSDAFGWDNPAHNRTQLFDHREWTTRKIDRKGAAYCTIAGKLYTFAVGYDYWNVDLYRQAVSARIAEIVGTPEPPEPQPQPEGVIDMYLVGVLGPNSPSDGPTPVVIRVGEHVAWEANATAQGIDTWFGVPYKEVGDADASTLLVSRTALNDLPDSVRNPSDPYYCPSLAASWHR